MSGCSRGPEIIFMASRRLRQCQIRLNATAPRLSQRAALAGQTDPRLRPAHTRAMQLLHLLLALLAPVSAAACQGAELDRQLILAKLRAQVLEYLRPSRPWSRAQTEPRRVQRRHVAGTQALHHQEREDTSQVILFPTTDVPCEPPQLAAPPEQEGAFTYLFQPSGHLRSRVVTGAQLWFHTGPSPASPGDPAAANLSAAGLEVRILSGQGQVAAAGALRTAEQWTVLPFAAPLLRRFSQKLLVLLVRCPRCPCVAEPDKMPFLVATTEPRGPDRARRSSVPWSPAALSLLQRPSEDAAAHAGCHRAALNISFEELGWDQWIVHPRSFVFHYCHGRCAHGHALSHALGFRLCCAALPSTMRPLRVRTTSDGGYSFKYETVPNILTQDCACI
ncbi:LOW QUALITY PROTEIN: inhibin alpha chain [Pelodiscus sinensis]|uniref:LOW QUALITY PROTEIN: inhibin alpha chain n=1 Tax=Pelodiscus sinensis TaxID=13735 RepID=UPI003F6AA39C